MAHLYVYYQVRGAHAGILRERVESLQKRLMPQTPGRVLLRRRSNSGSIGEETWMEIYEDVLPDFDRILDAATAEFELEKWIEGRRHIERFD